MPLKAIFSLEYMFIFFLVLPLFQIYRLDIFLILKFDMILERRKGRVVSNSNDLISARNLTEIIQFKNMYKVTNARNESTGEED